jgi:hypothetical protein
MIPRISDNKLKPKKYNRIFEIKEQWQADREDRKKQTKYSKKLHVSYQVSQIEIINFD